MTTTAPNCCQCWGNMFRCCLSKNRKSKAQKVHIILTWQQPQVILDWWTAPDSFDWASSRCLNDGTGCVCKTIRSGVPVLCTAVSWRALRDLARGLPTGGSPPNDIKSKSLYDFFQFLCIIAPYAVLTPNQPSEGQLEYPDPRVTFAWETPWLHSLCSEKKQPFNWGQRTPFLQGRNNSLRGINHPVRFTIHFPGSLFAPSRSANFASWGWMLPVISNTGVQQGGGKWRVENEGQRKSINLAAKKYGDGVMKGMTPPKRFPKSHFLLI